MGMCDHSRFVLLILHIKWNKCKIFLVPESPVWAMIVTHTAVYFQALYLVYFQTQTRYSSTKTRSPPDEAI